MSASNNSSSDFDVQKIITKLNIKSKLVLGRKKTLKAFNNNKKAD